MRIFLSTGEPSGEAHAAGVARALRARSPDVALSGIGGPALAAAGVDVLPERPPAVMGFAELATKLGPIRRAMRAAREAVDALRPDAVVLVDYPGFHLALAHRLRRDRPDQRILYYICPKFWAWNRRRLARLRRDTDEVLCIFPFEPELLHAAGARARFVGNPLLDALDLDEDGAALHADLGLAPGQRLVGMLPGSRAQEMKRHLPLFLAAADRLRAEEPDLALALAPPAGADREALASFGEIPDSVAVVAGRAHEVMAASTVVLAKSGTTALESALYGTPMVVAYRTSAVSAWIGQRVVRLRSFSLPNILTCDFPPPGQPPRRVVTELFQSEATPRRLADEALRLLRDPQAAAAQRQALLSFRTRLGGPGAFHRAAEAILELCP